MLRLGMLSPYNTVTEYQSYASSLALNTTSVPATRVSADGSQISYKEHTLHVPKWIDGLIH